MEVDSIYDLVANSGNSSNSAVSGNQPPLSKAVVNVGFILSSEFRSAVHFQLTPAQPAVYFDLILSFNL